MTHARLRRYLRHGTLPQLAAFEAVARLGSCSRAAEELHLSQPTISVRIAKLTESVGLALLVQAGKRVGLTPTGRELYAACQQLFAVFERLELGLAGQRTDAAGPSLAGDGRAVSAAG
jgi:DNA-binding transcriptional LysR family regulator